MTRIAITGLGLVTPIGVGAGAFYQALRDGRPGLVPDADLGQWVPRPDGAEGCAIHAARVGDFGARAAIPAQRLRRIPRLSQMCIVAAQQALALRGATGATGAVERYGAERIGVVLGTGLGAFDQVMEFTAGYLREGPEGASPSSFPTTVMNTAAAMLAMELSVLGPNITVNHRDLSPAEAVATGCEQLLLGRADAVLCGGLDELGPWTAHAYASVGALAHDRGPLRPYDRRRRGVALGEGAVVLLLERAEDAHSRGAQPLAYVCGIGRAGDDRPRLGYRRAGQPLATDGAAAAIAQALAAAGAAPDFIAGGGNGTDLDILETAALRRALGPAAEAVAVASILGQTGESMMSAGLRLSMGLYALAEQALPGTLHCDDPDPEAALPGLNLLPRPHPVRTVLLPVLGQGGGNVALCLCS